MWAESEKAFREAITQSCHSKGGWESAMQRTWKEETTEWVSDVRAHPEGGVRREGVEITGLITPGL